MHTYKGGTSANLFLEFSRGLVCLAVRFRKITCLSVQRYYSTPYIIYGCGSSNVHLNVPSTNLNDLWRTSTALVAIVKLEIHDVSGSIPREITLKIPGESEFLVDFHAW